MADSIGFLNGGTRAYFGLFTDSKVTSDRSTNWATTSDGQWLWLSW